MNAPSLGWMQCGVQRTGSWHLTHSLRDTARAGWPSDWFDPAERRMRCAEWDVDPDDFAAYLDAVGERATTPNGVIATKMMWNDFARFRQNIATVRPWADTELERIASWLPDTRWVWLRRRDKVRQGVSWWRADRTNQWRLAVGEARAEPDLAVDDAVAQIMPLVGFAQQCEDGWRSWFAEQDLNPLTVDYEDVVDDRDREVNRVLSHLGLAPLAVNELAAPRFRRQADDITERYVAAVRDRMS